MTTTESLIQKISTKVWNPIILYGYIYNSFMIRFYSQYYSYEDYIEDHDFVSANWPVTVFYYGIYLLSSLFIHTFTS